MPTRRQFLRQASLLTAASALPWANLFANKDNMQHIGIQLFSLPKTLDTDLRAGLTMLAEMGYKEIELFGPYPFSAPATIEGWKRMAPMLGFSGSGYFGKTAQELRALLDELGLSTPSAHTDLDTLEAHMDQLGEAAQVLGFQYVVLPAIPDARRTSLDDYRRMADTFNSIGENAKRVGLTFAYHNHGYGFQEVNGQIPTRLLLDNTDPELVALEMDIFWTAAAGVDPVELLRAYGSRYRLLHLKNMREAKRFAGDGGDFSQWMALFPYMSTAGEGVLDLPGIISAAEALGVKHYLVEQDLVASPEVALKSSFDYLAGL